MADVTNEIMTNDKTKILSGEFLNFYTPRRQRIRSFKVYFSPKQAGSGTPSPENVRPISGWTGVEVNHCGKNLFDESKPLLSGWLNRDGTSGGQAASTNKHSYKIPVKAGETYTYSSSIGRTTVKLICLWYDENNDVVNSFDMPIKGTSVTATAPENAVSVSLTIYNVDNQKIQFEVGPQATDYTPYKVGGIVPTEYQQVEYIQGNASCHIDTNVKGDDDSLVISGRMLTSIWGKYQSFFGNYIDEDHMVTRLLFGAKNNGNIICDVNRKAGNSTTVSMNFTVGEPHEFILEKSTITVDGTLYNYSGTLVGTENDTSIVLNAVNIGVVATDSSNYKRWYYFNIKNNNGTLLNYIPCYRKSDNVAGMWDTVSKQFYPSIGSEQFVSGPEVNPYSVDWSDEVGTVYGGYVDLISGELAETWKCIEVNSLSMLGGTSYGVYKLGNYEYAYINYDEAPPLCNILSLSDNTASRMIPGEFLVFRSNAYHDSRVCFRFKDTPVTSTDYEAKIQELSDNGTPLTVAFKITTPVIHQLSSTTISTLMFDNNFWSNADCIEIEYDYIGIFDPLTSRKNIFNGAPHLDNLIGNNFTFSTDIPRDLKKCVINFEPKQDFNGYDKPWPGGGGKNLFDKSTQINGSAINASGEIVSVSDAAYSDLIQVKEGSTYTFSATSRDSKGWIRRIHLYNSNEEWVEQGAEINPEATGKYSMTVTIPEGISYVRLSYRGGVSSSSYDTNPQLEFGSTATDYEPYSNICSIEGWDEIFVYPASANLLPLKWPSDSFLGQFGAGSTTISAASVLRCCSIYVGKNTQIRYQVVSRASFIIAFSDTRLTSRTGAKIYGALNMTNRDSHTFNSGEHPWLVFQFSSSAYPTSVPESVYAMLSFGNTNKTYSPRTDWGKIDIAFPEIIYGGYLDVLTGELWRTWRYIPLSNLTWSYNKSWKRFESSYITSATRAVYGQQNVYCDIYKAFPNTTGEDFQALGNYAITFNSSSPSNPYLIINDSRYTTKDDFVANLTGNIAYKLKTPQLVTTLEPQVIRTLQGVNNIWSNANGNLEIAYWKHGDDSYQHVPSSPLVSNDNFIIVTDDGYTIGEEDDFIVY